MNRNVIYLVVSIGFLISCSEKKSAEGTPLARVNEEILTMEELMYQVPPEYRNMVSEHEISEAVESWINTELLYQKGLLAGLDKDPEIKAVIKAGMKEAIATKFVDRELTRNIIVPMNTVDSIYALQKDLYKLDKDRYRASHILVSDASEAEALYNRLKKGDSFAALARDYSKDRQTAEKGGDIGFFSPDQIDPTIAETAKNLKVGSFSKPIKMPYGYHIILLTDRQAAGSQLDSLEVKRQIYEGIYSARHTDAFNILVDSLRVSADVEKYQQGIDQMTIPGSN